MNSRNQWRKDGDRSCICVRPEYCRDEEQDEAEAGCNAVFAQLEPDFKIIGASTHRRVEN